MAMSSVQNKSLPAPSLSNQLAIKKKIAAGLGATAISHADDAFGDLPMFPQVAALNSGAIAMKHAAGPG